MERNPYIAYDVRWWAPFIHSCCAHHERVAATLLQKFRFRLFIVPSLRGLADKVMDAVYHKVF